MPEAVVFFLNLSVMRGKFFVCVSELIGIGVYFTCNQMSLRKYIKGLFHNVLISFGEKAVPAKVPEVSSTNAINC